MLSTFNMGVGMALVIAPEAVEQVTGSLSGPKLPGLSARGNRGWRARGCLAGGARLVNDHNFKKEKT